VLRPIAGILVFRSLGFLPTYFRALVEGTRVP
jgi:hypothetical protein